MLFRKFLFNRFRMHLEEEMHKYKLRTLELEADITRQKNQWAEDSSREKKKLKDEHDLKLKEIITLTKLDSEQRIKQAELDAARRLNEHSANLNKEYFDKLSAAMTKLHEEGNVTTKFQRDIALEMLKGMPKNISETKVLTGTVDVKKG